MIVKKDSPITKIPKELAPNEILLLEAVRYSANMTLVAYGRLRGTLHELSIESKSENFWYAALIDAWAIIDSANRFYKLIKKMDVESPLLQVEYEKFKKLRDGFQHLDERIEEKHIKEHYPLFGVLAWCYCSSDDNMDKIKTFVFAPGIQQGEKKFHIPNPVGKEFRIPIDYISLTTNQRALSMPPVRVEMVPIIEAIEKTVIEIEKILDIAYNSMNNRTDIFASDIMFQFDLKMDKA